MQDIGETGVGAEPLDKPRQPVPAPPLAVTAGDADRIVGEVGEAHFQNITGSRTLWLPPFLMLIWQLGWIRLVKSLIPTC